MLLVIVVQFDLELEQMNVKITFLHGELEEKIYMKQPEGYIQEGVREIYSCNSYIFFSVFNKDFSPPPHGRRHIVEPC